VVADEVLAANAVSKVYDGDVVMTYSSSQVGVGCWGWTSVYVCVWVWVWV